MVSSKTVTVTFLADDQLVAAAKENSMSVDEFIRYLFDEYQRAQRWERLRQQFAATSDEDLRSYEEETKPWQNARARVVLEATQGDDWSNSLG